MFLIIEIVYETYKAVKRCIGHGFSIGCKTEFYILSIFTMVWTASFCAEVGTWA